MRSTPGTTWAIGLSALLIGGLALSLYVRGRSLPAPVAPVTCPAAAQLEGTWDDDAREALRQRFSVADALPYTATSRRTVVRLLDEYARDWRRARAQACTPTTAATPTRALVPTTDARVRCLDHAALAFSTTFAALSDPSTGTAEELVPHAVDAVRTLPAVDDCAWAHAPALPSASAAVLATATAHLALGRPDLAHAALPAITERPDLDPAVAGRAFALQATLARHDDDPAAAGPWLERSLWAALEQRDDARVVPTALALAERAAAEGDPARAQRWWRLASAWTTRFDAPADLADALVRGQAQLLAHLGHPRAALDLLEPRLAQPAGDGLPEPGAALEVASTARLAALVHPPERARALHERALAAIEQSFGPGHPHWEAAQLQFARALRRRDDPEARAAARGVLQDWLARPGGPPFPFDAATELGRWALEDDAPAEAAAALRHALASPQVAGTTPEDRLPAQLALARALAWTGDDAAAERAWADARSSAAQVYGDDDPRTAEIALAWAEAVHARAPAEAETHARRALEIGLGSDSAMVAWLILGSAAQATGRGDEALAAYERAEALARAADPPDPGRLAAVQLALASAAWGQGESRRAAAIVDAIVPRDATAPGDGPTIADLDEWRARRNLRRP